ncbi:OmpA family protein [bacterium]|nr:OmpA family protein [bacterium]
MGFANAFVGLADDGNALFFNPAGLPLLDFREVYGGVSRYYWGFSEANIMATSLSYIHSTHKYGCLAVAGEQFNHSVLSQFSFLLGYGYPLLKNHQWDISAGLSGEFYRLRYNEGEFFRFDFQDPLFIENGYSTFDFGLNAGLIARYGNISAGVALKNLNQPSAGLDKTDPDGRKPLETQFGFAYNFRDFLTPLIQLNFNEMDNLDYSFGVESWLIDKQLALRAGYDSKQNLTMGAGFYLKKINLIGIDYALTYYLSEVKSTTHRLSASVRFPLPALVIPPKEYPDLEILSSDIQYDSKNVLVEEPFNLKFNIRNIGEAAAENFYVSFFYSSPESLYRGSLETVQKLGAGDEVQMVKTWTPRALGEHQMVVSVDDDGALYPDLNGMIEENNEVNNQAGIDIFVYQRPVADIKLDNSVLPMIEMTYIKAEEPLVPVIFFDPDSSAVNPRFRNSLKEIAQRLILNSDVEIYLYGYIDQNTDSQNWEETGLHLKRAEAVKQILLSYNAPENRVFIAHDDYDPTTKRAGKSGVFYSERDRIWSSQENRRVELLVKTREDDKFIVEKQFSERDTTFDRQLIQELNRFAADVLPVLKSNPASIILVEGFSEEGENFSKYTFSRVKQAEVQLKKMFGDEVSTDRLNKLIRSEEGVTGKLQLSLIMDGMMYTPVENIMAGKDVEIPEEYRLNKVNISFSATTEIDTYLITIDEVQGKTINTLAMGEGAPPSVINWDWKDQNGNIIDPEKRYYARLYIRDNIGNRYVFKSDTVGIEVSQESQRMESLLMFQFVFDEIHHESKFFSGRLDKLTDIIIAKAMKPNNELKVNIIGHTDQAGTARHNQELSTARADNELKNIRLYLINKLGFFNEEQLDEWLKEHHTVLIARGASFKEPLAIERYRNGKYEEALLGDNEIPEGRSINRRVVIEFEERNIKE